MSFTVAVLLAAQAAGPQIDAKVHKAWQGYAACVQDKMVELEPSKADIDDIFEAAKTECAGSWLDAYQALLEGFEKRAPAPSGKSPQEMSVEMLDSAASGSKDRARVAILRKRAGLPPINVNTL